MFSLVYLAILWIFLLKKKSSKLIIFMYECSRKEHRGLITFSLCVLTFEGSLKTYEFSLENYAEKTSSPNKRHNFKSIRVIVLIYCWKSHLVVFVIFEVDIFIHTHTQRYFLITTTIVSVRTKRSKKNVQKEASSVGNHARLEFRYFNHSVKK